MTAASNAKVSTAQQKFGTGSMLLAAGTDKVSTPNSSDFDLGAAGSGDFTIECWIYVVGTSADMVLFNCAGTTDAAGWVVDISTANSGSLRVINQGSGSNFVSFTPTLNTWTHIAIVRSGSTVTAYAGGTSLGTLTDRSWQSASQPLAIGGTLSSYQNFNGYIDEVRISKGKARWTSNFTPPSAAYA